MKTIKVIFEQVSNRKGIATVSRLTSNEMTVKDNEGTIKFVNEFVSNIQNVVEAVLVTGQTSFKIGGQKFSLVKKMTFEVVIDGEIFSLTELISGSVLTLDKDNFSVSFKHLDSLAVNLYMTMQGAKGLPMLPSTKVVNQLGA